MRQAVGRTVRETHVLCAPLKTRGATPHSSPAAGRSAMRRVTDHGEIVSSGTVASPAARRQPFLFHNHWRQTGRSALRRQSQQYAPPGARVLVTPSTSIHLGKHLQHGNGGWFCHDLARVGDVTTTCDSQAFCSGDFATEGPKRGLVDLDRRRTRLTNAPLSSVYLTGRHAQFDLAVTGVLMGCTTSNPVRVAHPTEGHNG